MTEPIAWLVVDLHREARLPQVSNAARLIIIVALPTVPHLKVPHLTSAHTDRLVWWRVALRARVNTAWYVRAAHLARFPAVGTPTGGSRV